MALDCSWFTDSSFIADYIFAMIVSDLIFILAGIVIILLAYFSYPDF